MNDYDAAEYSAEVNAQATAKVAHLVGSECGWCGEPMESPAIVNEGTLMEDYACEVECSDHCVYYEVDDQEDFRADWDGRWSPEPEWDDRTGERLW